MQEKILLINELFTLNSLLANSFIEIVCQFIRKHEFFTNIFLIYNFIYLNFGKS